MRRKRCFFIGHRDTPHEVFELLRAAVEKHIVEYGVTEFIVGHYGGFDSMAAKAVIVAKKRHPHVSLLLLLPYHPAEHPIETPEGFDSTYYPEGMETVPRSFAIIRSNRYMVDHADHLIAYAWRPASNARDLVDYARLRAKKGFITVQNLAENTDDTMRRHIYRLDDTK